MSFAYFSVSLICVAHAAYGTGLQKDTLMELSFHIPTTNTTYLGDEERPPAQVLVLSPTTTYVCVLVEPCAQ